MRSRGSAAQTLHFTHSAPVGPSGGFFEDRQVSISVGRTDPPKRRRGDVIGWPARITVTNRRTGARSNRKESGAAAPERRDERWSRSKERRSGGW